MARPRKLKAEKIRGLMARGVKNPATIARRANCSLSYVAYMRKKEKAPRRVLTAAKVLGSLKETARRRRA